MNTICRLPDGTLKLGREIVTVEIREKIGAGFGRESKFSERSVCDLVLTKVTQEYLASICSWMEKNLSSQAPFDESKATYSNKRLYMIAELDELGSKGFCHVCGTEDGNYCARKVGSIFSSEGAGRSNVVSWESIERNLKNYLDFGYKEEIWADYESRKSCRTGELVLWLRGDNLKSRSVSENVLGKNSHFYDLLDSLNLGDYVFR